MPSPASREPHADTDPAAQSERLARLGAALDAWLAFQHGGGNSTAFLAAHPELRELLEPMLAETGESDATAPGAARNGAPNGTLHGTPHGALHGAPPGDSGGSGGTGTEPGRTVGDYRIRRELGRGGMGTVYEAEQVSLGRTVALKVLHRHHAWSPRSIARFRREAAAASRLRHPGIVPIHEVGEWQGLHYFSMELVDGRPLAELVHADRFGVRADLGRSAEAAELVARIADALQHAHEHELVHRDVKPHNVMVGADGTVRLLDFGLVANVAPDASASASGLFLGTPHYCSPEQIAGREIGPRADVFALGIVLYELLARQRPFDGTTTQIVLSRIESGEFPPLRRTTPGVPRDLETICHKALEHRAADRYANAGELAADLRRFLRIEPIHAVPPSTWTRSIKWVRRHRTRVALIVTSATLLIGAPLAWVLHRAGSERDRITLVQVDDAGLRSIELALSLIGDQLDRQPGPGAQHLPRVDDLERLCENILALRLEEPRRRARMARALWSLAGVYVHLGRHDRALAACQRARDVLHARPPSGDDTAPAVEGDPDGARLLALIQQRELHARQLDEPSGGDAEFERAIGHLQALGPRATTDPELVLCHAELLHLRGRNFFARLDRRADAVPMLRRAGELARGPLVAALPRAQILAARADAALGQVLLGLQRTEPALTLLRATAAELAKLPSEPTLAVDRAAVDVAIGNALQRLGRAAEAEAALRAAIDTAVAQLRVWPGSPPLRRSLVSSRTLLGTMLLVQRKNDAAETVLREALAAADSIPADDPTASTWMDRSLRADLEAQLANCLLLRDDVKGEDGDEAGRLLQRATERFVALVQEHPTHVDFHVDLAVTWNSRAALANERGDHAGGVAAAERAIEAQQAAIALAPAHTRAQSLFGMHQGQLAHGLARLGRADAAATAAALTIEHAPRHIGALRMAAEAATIAARTTEADPALPAEQRAERAEAQRQIAVRGLTRIAEVNRTEALRLLADDRFRALHEHEGFRALRDKVKNR